MTLYNVSLRICLHVHLADGRTSLTLGEDKTLGV